MEAIMRCTLVFIAAGLSLCAAAGAAQTMDANLAQSIAASCANCHGTNGVSRGGIASLAGMRKEDIVRTMQDFKAGTKPGTIMPQLAKGYTDSQVELAAGWFAEQKADK
jgi:sulfide dehydrogenase cytochrome subunit